MMPLQPGQRYGRGRRPVPANVSAARHARSDAEHGEKLRRLRKATAAQYDCRTLGQVGPVKDQGQCGDCYIFSSTGVFECAQFTAGVVSATSGFALSEQAVLDCGNVGGCDGGDEYAVAQQYMASGGIPSIAEYPGLGQNEANCQSITGKLYNIVAMGYCTVGAGANSVANTQDMKNTIVAYGPISVAVAAGSSAWDNYATGILGGNDNNIDHAVIIVGWDDTIGGGCWIMRNSWSSTWGIQGYAYVPYGNFSIGTEAFWVQATPVTPPQPLILSPVVSGPLVLTATVGMPFSAQVQASNSPTAYSAVSLASPPGIAFNPATGQFSGTPTAAGTYTLSLSATNAAGTSPVVTLTLTVGTSPPPPPSPGAVTITSVVLNNSDGSSQTLTVASPGTESVPTGTMAAIEGVKAMVDSIAATFQRRK